MKFRNGVSSILLCCLPSLGGCTSDSNLEKSARALREAGFQCLLDVKHMQFVESENCVSYPRAYAKFARADDDFRADWRYKFFGDDASASADAANGMATYLQAVAYKESGNPEHIRAMFREGYVKELHARSGKTFKRRPPSRPRY